MNSSPGTADEEDLGTLYGQWLPEPPPPGDDDAYWRLLTMPGPPGREAIGPESALAALNQVYSRAGEALPPGQGAAVASTPNDAALEAYSAPSSEGDAALGP